MALAQRLSEIDRDLDQLGSVPDDVTARVRALAADVSLDVVDRELESLASGVAVVESAPVARTNGNVSALKVVEAVETSAPVADDAAVEPAPPATLASLAAAASVAESSPDAISVPSEPPAPFATAVDLGAPERSLTMSEPPMSQPPEAMSDPFAGGLEDPFEGKPAPMPVPQRAPSVWPSAPPPKRTPSRTIRTSAAPPPPPPGVSTRPRSLRPTDTPDPFAPPSRATSRPPAAGLDADDLFGGMTAPPPADAPVRLNTSAAPPPKARPTMVGASTDAPPASDGDDFELLIDDEMLEIDVEEMDELD